jgi:penicillin-binding protein 1A
METVFVKILAAALAFSQVAVTPHAVKTEFSRNRDERQVVGLLQAGCTHMLEAFAIENINIDDLIETAMNDPQAVGGENREFRGINFGDLQTAYRQFCKRQETGHPVVDVGDVIDFYNKAATTPNSTTSDFRALASSSTAMASISLKCFKTTSAASGFR